MSNLPPTHPPIYGTTSTAVTASTEKAPSTITYSYVQHAYYHRRQPINRIIRHPLLAGRNVDNVKTDGHLTHGPEKLAAQLHVSRDTITDAQRFVENSNHAVHHLRSGKRVIRIAHGRHVVQYVAAYLSLNTT